MTWRAPVGEERHIASVQIDPGGTVCAVSVLQEEDGRAFVVAKLWPGSDGGPPNLIPGIGMAAQADVVDELAGALKSAAAKARNAMKSAAAKAPKSGVTS
jgi:hypothetical protein